MLQRGKLDFQVIQLNDTLELFRRILHSAGYTAPPELWNEGQREAFQRILTTLECLGCYAVVAELARELDERVKPRISPQVVPMESEAIIEIDFPEDTIARALKEYRESLRMSSDTIPSGQRYDMVREALPRIIVALEVLERYAQTYNL